MQVPFRERSAPWNALLIGQWGVVEVVRVATEDPDVVGWGETLPAYTSQTVTDDAEARARGQNPVEYMWDGSLGAGLQMALFDVVGKATGIPMSRLLGPPQVRDWCSIAWWNTKMPPDVLAAEAEDAVDEGYRAHKFKARPWFDVYEQVEQISSATPDDYTLDIDWNAMLIDAGTASKVLTTLDAYQQVGIYEGPIFGHDLAGYRALREKVRRPLVEHSPPEYFAAGLRADAFDGYVLDRGKGDGSGVRELLRRGVIAQAFGKSGWVQAVGTGLTTALALHASSVLPAARWPTVTALNIFTDDLIVDPIVIRGGYAQVPTAPGLGVTVDEAALESLRMEPPYTVEYPRKLLTFVLPSGRRGHYASMPQLWKDCRVHRNVPPQDRGANLEVTEDDGSADFDELFRRAATAPVWETSQ